MNGLRILVNIAQHPNWALDTLCHYISSKHGFYVLKPCQALLNWQGFREGTIQTSGKFSLLLSVRRLKVYSFNRERWNNFWKLSLISILNAQFLGKHNTQWSFSNMLISLVINVVFQQCLCSLNLYLKIKVWIYIFMCEKKSSKEMKVDSRTHFAGDLLIRDTTFSWSLQSVSRETHCPFEVAKGPDVSATPGLTSWTFWVTGMIWITSVSLKTNFRNFEGLGINGSNTDQLNDPFLRKTGPDRSI